MKKILLIIATIFILLFVACWIYIQSDLFTAKIRPLIAGPLQDVLGPDARFGRIKANLFPFYLEVRDIIIPSSRTSEAIAVRRVRFYINPFSLIYRTISISSITVLEPRISVTRSAAGENDLSGVLRDMQNSAGTGSINGKSHFNVHIRTITVKNGKVVLHDTATGLKIAMNKMDINIKTSVPGYAMSARIASADINVSSPGHHDVSAHARGVVEYDQGKLSFDSIELYEDDANILLTGSFNALTGNDINMRFSTQIGQHAVQKATDLFSGDTHIKGPVVNASASITGSIHDPVMEGRIRIADVKYKNIKIQDMGARLSLKNNLISVRGENWKFTRDKESVTVHEVVLSASYNNTLITVHQAQLRADDADLNVSGSIRPDGGYSLFLAAESSGASRSLQFLANVALSGDVVARGTLSGPLDAPHFEGQLTARPVTVRGIKFSNIDGKLIFQDRKLLLTDAKVRQGVSQYDFDGSVELKEEGPFYQANLGVHRSDVASIVALFYKRIPLDITASGNMTFSGTNTVFTGTAHLDLGPGAAYGESFDKGSLDVILTKERITFTNALLSKNDGRAKGKGWIAFDGSYDADIQSDGLDLSQIDHIKDFLLNGPFELDIRSSGSFSKPEVHAHLNVGSLSYRRSVIGAAKADIVITDGMLQTSAAISSGIFDMNGTMKLSHPYPWSAVAKVNLNKFELFSLIEVGDFLSKMKVSTEGTIKAHGTGVALNNISGSAAFRQLGFSLNDLQIENVGDAIIRIDAGRLLVQSLMLTGSGTKLAVSGNTQLGSDIDLTLTGNANLSLLRVLFRDVEHGDGTALVKLSVTDKWSSPDVAGDLIIKDGQIKIKDIPQKFTNLNGTIGFDRNRVITEGIRGEVGGGSITLTGSAQLEGSALVDFSLKAAIENVAVRYPPGMTATLGGSLYYDGDAASQTLSGEVGIRRARYEKRVEWKSMLVDFSRGFTQKKKEDIGWIGDTQLNVRFFGKENILFESNLAKIPLDIDMLFFGTVGQPQLLGRIEARKGEVYFRQNVFRIIHASADFTDPGRINPTLDVQAETRVREYQIRLGVSGTADRATVAFVSDPALTDSNILALLTLGKKGEELKGKEASVGVGEATSFATGKFQDILENRARNLTGLDRFQVDPYLSKTDVAVPRVTVGKALVQDKLFMTYSSNVGASTPEQVFRIEYVLNKNMSLVGERNEIGNLGADVKFRFEFR